MSDTLYCVVLPSGRVAKIAEPTLERAWEVTEAAGALAGGSSNKAKLWIAIDKELVRVHLRAITRGPVPWRFLQVDELVDGKPTGKKVDGPEVDFDGMVGAARQGAGGGFLEVSYQDLVSAGERSVLGLFNSHREDFESLVAQINALSLGPSRLDPKAPPAAALLGRRVVEATG